MVYAQRVGALDALLALTGFVDHDMHTDLARRCLSAARAPIDWFLCLEGPLTQTALAELLHVSPRNITGLVEGLVADVFVERRPHPRDRRATLVTLTDYGAETVAALHADRSGLADDLFAGWPAQRVAHLSGELAAVLAQLRARIGGCGLVGVHRGPKARRMTGHTGSVVPVNPRDGAMQMAAALEAGVWRALIQGPADRGHHIPAVEVVF